MLGRQPTGYDANMRWQASPGAVGYRIFWRDAWTPDWEHEITVGNVTEYVMPNVSIDEYVFGIAAIGPGVRRARSPPTSTRAPRVVDDVKLAK